MDDKRGAIPDLLHKAGGLKPGVAKDVHRQTGIPEADIHGVGTFFHLLSQPDIRLRVCTGLACTMAGSHELLAQAREAGYPVEECACLAACDKAPAALSQRTPLAPLSADMLREAGGDWQNLDRIAQAEKDGYGHIGPANMDPSKCVYALADPPQFKAVAFAQAVTMGPDAVFAQIEASGLQGRGGAGFPAHIKWRAVHGQADPQRYLVLNADEGEPGTFKDREIMIRRPDLVLEGLAIAAHSVGASEIYLYLRGEFTHPWRTLEQALARFEAENAFPGLHFHFHAGQGAYICGEETALLEALEGKRGMPRLKPPFPVEVGLWNKPTLIHNVETIAAVPAIIKQGGPWFYELGRGEPGSKLYCISGHVHRPGTYEMPLGVTLDELVQAAGGYIGELKAFSPGGASSGFLPASMRRLPLGFKSLAQAGSMLGSAGVTVLNQGVNMKWAAMQQLRFFEKESCGQCAPCRIGTRYLREITETDQGPATGTQIEDVAWQMREGSICGLGQAAYLPLTSARQYFPEDFE